MWNFLKNPFSESDRIAPRKSAQKEQEAQTKAHRAAAPALAGTKAAAPRKEASAAPKKGRGKGVAAAGNLEAGFGIIIKPHVSEKTARFGAYDTYAFVVSSRANKVEIKKAFKKMYGVEPVAIQVANMASRSVQFRRVPGSQSAWRKAYIRVPKGSSVAVYEGV
ncbi:MAG: 50S ribosomal protein L23 [bacterium]|nr:50S ribosomal protein L23 [bacterium]